MDMDMDMDADSYRGRFLQNNNNNLTTSGLTMRGGVIAAAPRHARSWHSSFYATNC
jgi:hypothetical protein